MWRINGKKAGEISQAVAMRYQQRFMGHIYESVLTQRVFIMNRDSEGKEYCVGYVLTNK